MHSFFVGTALEHDRQTSGIVGQVGCAALEREDVGRPTYPERSLGNSNQSGKAHCDEGRIEAPREAQQLGADTSFGVH
jgi:hypothetical protein